MKYSYYPGCSLRGTAKEYDISTRAVCEALDIELQELEDWNCCGATSAHALDRFLSIALPARNLVIAEKAGLDLAVPCAACFGREKACERALEESEEIRERLATEMNLRYGGGISVKHLLDVVVNDYGLERLKERVKNPLEGVKAVGYYGCLIVRPPAVTQFDDPEDPTSIDEIIKVCGAELVTWYAKTICCGAGLSISRTAICVKLVGDILSQAKAVGADCIVVACPLCQTNLDTRQSQASELLKSDFNIPILYFTQLLGLAMGIEPKRLGLSTHIVQTRPLIEALSA